MLLSVFVLRVFVGILVYIDSFDFAFGFWCYCFLSRFAFVYAWFGLFRYVGLCLMLMFVALVCMRCLLGLCVVHWLLFGGVGFICLRILFSLYYVHCLFVWFIIR